MTGTRKNPQWTHFLLLSAFLAVITMVAFTFFSPHKKAGLTDHQRANITLNGKPLTVEVVNTPESLEKGLGDRDVLGSDGMLFLLPDTRVPTFWMKGMRFDLDMVWLKDNQVVDVSLNATRPPVTGPQPNLPLYYPSQPANMVLELNAGQAKKLEIHNGDRLEFVLP